MRSIISLLPERVVLISENMHEFLPTSNSSIRPIERLKEKAAGSRREIKECWWFGPVQIDFDLPEGEFSEDSRFPELIKELSASLRKQGHPEPAKPSPASKMIIGFHEIPPEPGSLFERVQEIYPLALTASKKYDTNVLEQNYTVVVALKDDIAGMKKREMERVVRMLMARLGALKIIILHSEYYALATMEGGFGIEPIDKPEAIDRLRDRLVTHAIAKESGKCKTVPDVISEEQWRGSEVPGFITEAFRQLGEWGYIDKPFDLRSVVSDKRAGLIELVMGWSRQSESAGAAFDPAIQVSEEYRIGKATGVIMATASGRFGADKTNMNPETDITPVTIVPKPDYQPNEDDLLSLYGFGRYALGIKGRGRPKGPSIEFDEMSVPFRYSEMRRVSLHPSEGGWRLDPNGEIFIPRVRGFVHIHQGIREIRPQIFWGKNALQLVEYVPANLKDYPYPVGCGKDIMFACTADATRRSRGVNDLESGYLLTLFDAINHGTNILLLTKPLPGTDLIPEDPFEVLLPLLDPEKGAIVLTNEIAQI